MDLKVFQEICRLIKSLIKTVTSCEIKKSHNNNTMELVAIRYGRYGQHGPDVIKGSLWYKAVGLPSRVMIIPPDDRTSNSGLFSHFLSTTFIQRIRTFSFFFLNCPIEKVKRRKKFVWCFNKRLNLHLNIKIDTTNKTKIMLKVLCVSGTFPTLKNISTDLTAIAQLSRAWNTCARNR